MIRPSAHHVDTTRARFFRDVFLASLLLIGGLALRLYGISSSFWLDEFGTLWSISGTAADVIARVDSFHPQTALYYLVAWVAISLFGITETVVRSVSVVAWIAFSVLLSATTVLIGGRKALIPAVLVAVLSAPLVIYAVNARPYMLGMTLLMATLYFLSRATVKGDRFSGLLFGLFGGLTFLAHYLIGLALPGVVAVLLISKSNRGAYPLASLLRDILIMCAVALLGAPHFLRVLHRGSQLNWLDSPDVLLSAGVLVPLVPAAAVSFSSGQLRLRNHLPFLAAFISPLLTILAASFWGLDLLHPRYVLGSLPPLAVMAAVGLASRTVPTAIALALFALPNVVTLGHLWRWTQTFTGINSQDWRGAQDILVREQTITPAAVVLYRSGLVEQDILPLGVIRGPSTTPLQSPGKPTVSFRIVPLTYRWSTDGREAYFERLGASLTSPGGKVIFISPVGPFSQDYKDRLVEWLRARSPRPVHLEHVPLRGILMLIATIPQ